MKGEMIVDLLPTVTKIDKKRKWKTGGQRKKKLSDLSKDVASLILQRLTLVDFAWIKIHATACQLPKWCKKGHFCLAYIKRMR